MNRHIVVAAVLLIVALADHAQAQDVCRPSETVVDCVNRVRDELLGTRDEAKESAKAEQLQQAKKTETGLDDVAGLGSSVKDFLPLLQFSGVLGAVETDEKSGLVTVALNSPFLGSSGSNGKKDNSLQVKAVVDTTAKLFEPLKKLLPEDNRDALGKKLLGRETDPQNVTVEAGYNVSSRKWGRNFHQHKDTLDALFEKAIGAVTATRDSYAERIATLNTGVDVDLNVTRWIDVGPDKQLTLARRILGMVEAEKQLSKAITVAIKDAGLDVYGQLVSNQPQLLASVSKAFRDDVFGPDLLKGRISLEWGIGNSLNAALGALNGTCAVDSDSGDKCLKVYSKFAKDASTRAAIKAGSRLSFFAEFVQNDAYHFISADPVVELKIAGGTGWSAGLDYGRLIAVDEEGRAGGRVDGSFRWEAPADTAVDRRFVASLTLTKKLGDLAIPFGLVYANKPKFLTGVDKGLTANVGLKFNLFPGLK